MEKLDIPDGPCKRSSHAWARDAASRKTYLYGGADQSGCLNDLFCFDDKQMTWEEMKTTGDVPEGVEMHTAQFMRRTKVKPSEAKEEVKTCIEPSQEELDEDKIDINEEEVIEFGKKLEEGKEDEVESTDEKVDEASEGVE